MKYNLLLWLTILTTCFYVSTSKANETKCLVEAVYYEARSESLMAQLSVANVILERVFDNRFPNTICGVVHQGKHNKRGQPIRYKCMFSYWCDGKPERMKNIRALQKAIEVSDLALQGVFVKSTLGATHYHATYVKPAWSRSDNFKYLGRMGRHLFYVDIRNILR